MSHKKNQMNGIVVINNKDAYDNAIHLILKAEGGLAEAKLVSTDITDSYDDQPIEEVIENTKTNYPGFTIIIL